MQQRIHILFRLHSNAAALSTQKRSRNKCLKISQVMSDESCPVLNHVLNSLTPEAMKIRTDLAKGWYEMVRHTSDTLLPCCGGEEKSSLLHFNGSRLYRVGVTTSNILPMKACAICPLLGGFQMSEHQAINMAPTLRGGGNSDINLLISLSPCRPAAGPHCCRCNPLSALAEKIGFLCLSAISATVSPHNQLISKRPSSSADSHGATGRTHTHINGGSVTQHNISSPLAK